MRGPKSTPIDDLVSQHLEDPETLAKRRELAKLLEATDNDFEDREIANKQTESEEEEFIPPSMIRKPRGPIINGMQAERERQAEEKVKRLLGDNYVPPEGPKKEPSIKQDFNPDLPVEGEEAPRQVISNGVRPKRGAQADGPIDPPDILIVERLQKRLDDQAKEIALLKQGANIPHAAEIARKSPKLASLKVEYNPKYSKLEPPSNGVFSEFDFADLFAKNVDVQTQIAITKARDPNVRDMSSYIDALSTLIRQPMDLRDFTYDDFFYFLYYTKYNSYSRIPLVLRWTSKYGNENLYTIKETDLRYINPVITKEEYQTNFKAHGIHMPTLRDWEILNVENDFDEEDLNIYRKAQYFEGATIEEKVVNYFKSGENLDALSRIAELQQVSRHGVINTVDVIDAKFNVKEYLDARIDYTEALKREMEEFKESNIPLYLSYRREVDESETEIKEKQAILQNGGQVRPEVETVPVRFNALDIFPLL